MLIKIDRFYIAVVILSKLYIIARVFFIKYHLFHYLYYPVRKQPFRKERVFFCLNLTVDFSINLLPEDILPKNKAGFSETLAPKQNIISDLDNHFLSISSIDPFSRI